MKPTKILYVDVSPTPSYGGSKRVLTNIFAEIDRNRWVPHALYYREGAYVAEVSAMGIWARAPIGLPGQRREEDADGKTSGDLVAPSPQGGQLEEGLVDEHRGREGVAGAAACLQRAR